MLPWPCSAPYGYLPPLQPQELSAHCSVGEKQLISKLGEYKGSSMPQGILHGMTLKSVWLSISSKTASPLQHWSERLYFPRASPL